MELTLRISSPELTRARDLVIDSDHVTLGLSDACDVQIPLSMLSSHHLTFFRESGAYWVQTHSSAVDTNWNGEPLCPGSKSRLATGGCIRIASLSLEVVAVGSHSDSDTVDGFTVTDSERLAKRISEDLQPSAESEPAFVEILRGERAGTTHPLPEHIDEEFLGNSDDCLVTLEGNGVPGHAVALETSNGNYVAEPAHHASGMLNGQPWDDETVLEDGDTISIGQTMIRFRDPLESLLADLPGATDSPEDLDRQPGFPREEESAAAQKEPKSEQPPANDANRRWLPAIILSMIAVILFGVVWLLAVTFGLL